MVKKYDSGKDHNQQQIWGITIGFLSFVFAMILVVTPL